MPSLTRRDYDPTDLDPATGPTPAFGNPGALTNHIGEQHHNRECTAHSVRWRGVEDCWLCIDESEN